LAAGPEREKSERLSTTCSSSFLFPANPTIVSPETRRPRAAKSGHELRRFGDSYRTPLRAAAPE